MKDIRKIIDELYLIEPDLKAHEVVLLKVIEELLASKPDTKFDDKFARTLKARLLAEPVPTSTSKSFLSFKSMKRNYLVMAGAAFAVLVLAIAVEQNYSPVAQPQTSGLSLRGQHIARVSAHAFGALSNAAGSTGSATESAKDSAGSRSLAAPSAPLGLGMGGGGGGGSAPSATQIAPGSKIMPRIYRPYYYTYTYKGEALELKDQTVDVYQRVKPQLNTSAAVNALRNLSFGGLDLGTFGGGQVMNYQIGNSETPGYMMTVNLTDGTASIYQNYATTCPKGICPVLAPLQPSDVPSDADLIAVSNRFLNEHHVDLSNYDTPQIQNDWKVSLMASDQPTYVPDIMTVMYPLKVSGTPVYDLSGNPTGLNVNINIRDKSVNGVWDITNQDYQASAYDAETDASRVISIVQQGGIYGNFYKDPNAEEINIELGTPKRILTTMWRSDGETSGEVIVPALSFPVLKAPADQPFYQKAIVVPLAKQLLQVPEPGPIKIMKGAGSEGVATPPVEVVPPVAPQAR